jgi:glycolate oxidase
MAGTAARRPRGTAEGPRAPRVDAARRALERELSANDIWTDPLALRLYSRDASMIEGACGLVVFPTTREQVVACLRVARDHDLPLVPRGAGTGLAGGATPIGEAMVLITMKLNRVREVRPEDRLAWVEPGVINLDLSHGLRPLGLTFAPDPSSQQSSTIGGNVATNAGGPHCLAYGVTSNHILAVEVVFADGSIATVGSEAPECAGYDLRGLLVGSEGTLGIVTAVCVRLTPIPPAVRTMLMGFPTIEDAADTVSEVIARGVVPAAMELMDAPIVRVVEEYVHAGYPTDAAAVLLVELDGLPGGVAAQTRVVEEVAHDHHAGDLQVASDDAHRALLWKGRKSALGAVSSIAPNYYLHDCVVPRARLAEVLTGVKAIAERHGVIVVNMFHAGDGNLHPLLLFDRRQPGAIERVLAASEQFVTMCVEAGGSLSGEHGIGLEKRDFMPLMFSAGDLAAQDCLRAAFDPDRRMNPEKVLPEGARCGEFAMARGTDLAVVAQGLPEGSWI